MKHDSTSHQAADSMPVLPWIIGGVLGLGLPALSITFTYGFLIHLPRVDGFVQRVGHPFMALLPGLAVAIVALVAAGYLASRNTAGRVIASMVGIGGIVATIVVLWTQLLVLRQSFPLKQVAFNATQWHDAGCGTSRVRQMMLTGLVQQIRGMTPQQVTSLLGPNEVGESSYCLGPEPSAIPTDRLTLRVLYDAHGQAVDVRVSAN